jgi:signal transduction histidine kinase/CheY-like chemotaxis protein
VPLPRIVIALLLLCCLPLSAAAHAALSVLPDAVSLVPHARIVKDPTGTLAAEALLAQEPAAAAAPGDAKIVSFGFTDAAYWFLIDLENPAAAPLSRYLVVDPTWLDDVRGVLLRPDGTTQDFAGGDTLPFAQRAVPQRKINFALELPPGRSRLLVRTQTRDPFLVGLTLVERSALFAAGADEAGYYGVLYGAIGALLLFNLFLFFSVREPVYGSYVLYLAGFLLAHATYNGHLYGWLWPSAPEWGNWAHSIHIYLFLLAGIFFSIQFLELREKLPAIHRWARGLALVMVLSILATGFIGGYALHVATSILWVLVYSPFVLLLGVLSLRARNRAARYFITGTAAGFLGSLITALTVSALIPYSLTGYRAVDYGMLVDAILLSLALADRLRLARADADRAKADLIEAQRSHTRQLEDTVRERTRELSEANAIKDKFFTIVAHDLRGPIGGLAALFDKRVLTSPADLTDERLDLVRASIGQVRDFLEELLTWARSQRGEIDCHPEAIDLQELLRETQALLSAQAYGKGIRLDLGIAERLWVYADPAMTRGILRNLVQNALKFTDGGGSVRASVGPEGSHCRIAIIDTGVGMDEEVRSRLFRLDVKTTSTPGTRHEPGTGLGLILCKEFAERNGGTIGVSSAPGRGSNFWFTLPRTQQPQAVDHEPLVQDFSAVRILVVEDDRLHRDAAAHVLAELGCAPRFAADGDAAVRLAQEAEFDIIFMDIDLPGSGGIEAARRIRAHGSRAQIVSLSSYSRQEIARMAGVIPFDKCLYKPLTTDDAVGLILS